ncbi:retron Ec67 family RNA-directed DNA polymerase/endonuclease [Rhizobium ruizarguesonis]|uniref:retron Ec67 family RNA-directed DNA polymerase/endonuclease n=1 Tax=Rhizobium ruizarguesonis TaxID=2081791 RepID=UPI001030D3E5|nr:retron Ec67 family RNA-directed DNA polymerase/endonuclease [Rhizobium ruizarguesonis]TAT84809.1 RNA-directed DNA polymerase [Rhizobium ruizarguesonis]
MTLKNLRACKDLSDLAHLLSASPKGLSYILYKIPPHLKYTRFEVPKKSGGTRTISSPERRLKFVQSRLTELLYACQREIVPVEENIKKVLSHGFQKKRGLSIQTNAGKHTNRRFVLNVDLEDFFPSLNFGRVRGSFLKNRDFQLPEPVATVIAQIVCHDNELPQGAPTSPIVSDLMARVMDVHLSKMAAAHGCTYSRYVDDLTFSTNLAEFPPALALENPLTGKWDAGHELRGRIWRQGFTINDQKTRMQTRASRQEVTGLIVNEFVNVRTEIEARNRVLVHALMKKGTCFQKDPKSGAATPMSLEEVGGRLSHQFQIKAARHGFKSAREFEKAGDDIPKFYRDYAHYINYCSFHVNPVPTIVCEGKTDVIYLKTAIQVLHAKFPKLGGLSGGKYASDVRFFGQSRHHTAATRLSGGAGDVQHFVRDYNKIVLPFHAGGQLSPVIVFVDNDKATNGIWSFIKERTGSATPIDGSDPFYHIERNLFVVAVPGKVGNTERIVEDLFDAATKAMTWDGKTVDLKQKRGQPPAKGKMSKERFATKIVRDQRSKIDFSGFEPVLKAFSDIIDTKLTPSK